ncbi:hypothetical protein MUK42_37715 [Musa troglodytarum]|uniref:Uncharacterized protein n=1 Tax=Musa troglodytarum TaxID=320322 RepID=A0A9E7GD72_9LILI|nr:hypothetical protein MUK42_37715 [Musa troglodytarum]
MRSCRVYKDVVDAFQLDTQPSPTSWTAAARFLAHEKDRLNQRGFPSPSLPPSLPLLISLLCFPHAISPLTSLPLQVQYSRHTVRRIATVLRILFSVRLSSTNEFLDLNSDQKVKF